MAVVLTGSGAFVYLRMRADLLAAVDMGLMSRAGALADATRAADAHRAVRERGSLLDPDEAFAQVLDPAGVVIDSTPGIPRVSLLRPTEAGSVAGPTFTTRRVAAADDPVRLLAMPVRRGHTRSVVVVGSTLGDVDEAVGRLLTTLIVAGPAVLAVTVAGGWLLAGAALRPVDRLRVQAASMSGAEPGRRLPSPGTGDELERLAVTLNTLLDRVDRAMAQERRFVADASHELRTPLATLRAEIELALDRPRPNLELTEALRSAEEDVQRLQRLADDLLVLARSQGGAIPVNRRATSLRSLVDRELRSIDPQARAARVRLTCAAPDERVDIDRDRIEQALRNLLENAVRATPAGGAVHVDVHRESGSLAISVIDTGPGFAPEFLPTRIRAVHPWRRSGARTGRRGSRPDDRPRRRRGTRRRRHGAERPGRRRRDRDCSDVRPSSAPRAVSVRQPPWSTTSAATARTVGASAALMRA